MFKKVLKYSNIMKCDLCSQKIEETFLEKIKGTYIGRYKGKKVVCPSCQKKYSQKEISKKLGFG